MLIVSASSLTQWQVHALLMSSDDEASEDEDPHFPDLDLWVVGAILQYNGDHEWWSLHFNSRQGRDMK
jgi:hypothetical protein